MHFINLYPLKNLESEEFNKKFSSMPQEAKTLYLQSIVAFVDYMEHGISAEKIIQAIKLVPENITHINFGNTLSKKSKEEIAKILAEVPGHITFVELDGHLFSNMGSASAKDVPEFLPSIPLHITHLGLKRNGILAQMPEMLERIFGSLALHKNIFFLDLSGESYFDPSEERLSALSKIPPQIKVLDLSDIQFHFHPFLKFIHALPESIDTLILRDCFDSWPIELFVEAFESLPSHITKLDISHNQLPRDFADLMQFFKALPAQVSEITIKIPYSSYSEEQLIALADSLQYATKVNLVFEHDHLLFNTYHENKLERTNTVFNAHIGKYRKGINRALGIETIPPIIADIISSKIAGAEQPTPSPDKEINRSLRIETIPEQESYSFQFNCLAGLAVISAIALVVGIAALFLVTPIGVGLGLAGIGSIGALISGYGLFQLPSTIQRAERDSVYELREVSIVT